jgi:hypothetical protein
MVFYLKGTVSHSRDFLLLVFFMNQFPLSPLGLLRIFSKIRGDIRSLRCSPPHPCLGPRKETHHWLSGEGVGGPNSDEGIDTLLLYLYYNPSALDAFI